MSTPSRNIRCSACCTATSELTRHRFRVQEADLSVYQSILDVAFSVSQPVVYGHSSGIPAHRKQPRGEPIQLRGRGPGNEATTISLEDISHLVRVTMAGDDNRPVAGLEWNPLTSTAIRPTHLPRPRGHPTLVRA